jgi:3-oxoacyl-[acyl-carrier-protein] synthase-3
MLSARIAGIGGYRPERVVPNDAVCPPLRCTPDWIVRRSGITSRRFAGPRETLVEMGADAADKALADAGISPLCIDQVIVATMSDVNSSAPLSHQIAARCGITAGAWDVNAACAGFTVALAAAAAAVHTGSSGNSLVVGTERMSDIIAPDDPSTAFLFGDGAGAVVVTGDGRPGIAPVVQGTRTDLLDAITVQPEGADGRPCLRMSGSAVYRWAVTSLPTVIRTALERADVRAADIRAFVPHQSNLRIIDAVAVAVGFSADVVIARDIVAAGNTSAASIPLALDALRSSGAVASGDLAVLVGYGAGLTYAAMVARVP